MNLLEWLIVVFAAWLAFGKSQAVTPSGLRREPFVTRPRPTTPRPASSPVGQGRARQVIRPKPPQPVGERPA